MSARDQLVEVFQIALAGPASAEAVASLESALGCPLPGEVKAWYAEADGGQARAAGTELQLLSVEGVKRWLSGMRLAKSAFGLLPFAENNDSNPLCICCKGPLAGFVVQTPHDDEPALLYRSAEGFFREALEQFEREGFFEPHELNGDIDGAARSEEDPRLAQQLLELAGTAADELDRHMALSFACDLFPASEVAQICGLIELGGEDIREHVLFRLQRIDSPESRAALEREQKSFDDFVDHCAELIRAAGVAVSVHSHHGRKSLRLEETKTWLNMPMLFARRSSPDFTQHLREVAGRKR